MIHLHEVRDTDSHYVIDPITRAITNANSAKNKLMQGDHNSEIYTFEIPRIVEGHDMTLCNAIRIHFNDISADKANESRDFFPVEDMHIDEVQTDTLVFSWLVSGTATMYAGLLSFRIQFLCINDSGNVTYKWHTDIFKGITISDGFDNSEAVVAEYSDVITKWEAELFGTGDSVIANIQNAASEQMAAVEAKGAETLETIPDDYTELYGMAKDAIRTRANAIVENAEGNAIAANDCSSDYLRGLRVFGKSEQIKTTGAQLFDKASAVTGMLEENGTVTTDGAYLTSDFIPVLPNTAYYQTQKDSIRGKYYDADKNPLSETWDVQITTEATFTTFANAYYLRVTVSVACVDTYMLNIGTTGAEYEPYTGGIASPSPEYPQEINNVENAVVSVYGKNLLKVTAKTQTTNGITFTVNDDGSVTIDGTATAHTYMTLTQKTLFPAGSYVLSGCNGGGSTSYFLYFDIGGIYNFDGETEFVVDSPSEKQAIVKVHSGVTVSNVTIKPMARLASVDNGDFEPYTDQTISIPYTLPGIPVTSGGNYTDANGQQWICDEVDLARGVYIKRISRYDVTGQEGWYISNLQNFKDEGYYRYDVNIAGSDGAAVTDVLCTHFPYSGANFKGAWALDQEEGLSLRIIGKFASVAELKAFLVEQSEEAPVTFYYALWTPIETALTDEEIFNSSQLHSNYPNTTVLNDAGAWMEVAYNADTELYFNNSRGASDEQVEKSVDAWLTAHFTDAEEVSF